MKFDKIVGIGCSFTEGGGLNNIKYYNYLNNLENLSQSQETLNTFMYENNYIAKLSKLMDIPYENLSESQSSNELIFKKLYNRFVNNTDNILLVLQTTFFGRKHIWNSNTNKYYKMSGSNLHGKVENESIVPSNDINQFYENYLGYFYNELDDEKDVFNMADVYNSFLKEKNVTMVLLPLFKIKHKNFTKNTLLFDNLDLQSFAEVNKLRISDLNININDFHLSDEGNELIARKIYNFIEYKYART